MSLITIASTDPTTPLGTLALHRDGDALVLTATDEDGLAVQLPLSAGELAALLAAGGVALAAMLA